ncbi:hypothetical protein [Melittangium boletus]|uniref:hypothetical protein n=1 Tax=Melittangium boletus TaxID=83453 RepID=UPI000BB2D05B|nr:hypothetical protein [Melittangium boletus]
MDSDTAWPGNVPSRPQALEALRDRLTLPMPLPKARRVLEKLTPPEREAISGRGFCPLLREATVVRWRLAAAADLLPAAGARRSAVALRALLIEVNQMLSALRVATSSSPELALALDTAGERLNEEASVFLRSVKAVAEVRRAPPRRSPRLPTASRAAPPHRATRRWAIPPPALSAALVLTLTMAAVAGVSTLQGRARSRAFSPKDATSNAAPHALVMPHPDSGALLVRSTLLGPETEEQRAWLRLQEAKGMQVTTLGPGSYLVAPAHRADSSTGRSSTP